MKYWIYIWAILLIACREEEQKSTTIKGTVIYADSAEVPNNIVVGVSGINDIFPGGHILNDTSLVLDNNTFEVSLSYVEELDYYAIYIDFVDNDVVVSAVNPSDLDCSPYNCDRLPPGRTYDLTVRIPEGNP